MGLVENIVSKFFGSKAERDIKQIMPIVQEILKVHASLKGISNDALRAKTDELRAQIQQAIAEDLAAIELLKAKIEEEENLEVKENFYAEEDKIQKRITDTISAELDRMLPLAFAIMKETASRFASNERIEVTASEYDRKLAVNSDFVEIVGNSAIYKNSWTAGGNIVTWDMVHYDVQLIGGVVLHQGKIAEMGTGEGKTLVATLPVFLNALSGRGVHMVTVNDYLSKRDSEWMGPLYQFHGISVDCIDKHQPNSEQRRLAYEAGVTFGTNNEFGFDYLRDNMALSPEDLVQRPHNYAIVDEVDSVLIDDARTPLIISGPTPKGENQQFLELKPSVEKLIKAQRELFAKKFNEAKQELAKDPKSGTGGFYLVQANKMLPKNKSLIKFLSESGMKTLMLKTEDIYLSENAKRMPEVTEELYFVIEEKNNSVDLTEKGIELISKDAGDSNFFLMPDIGSVIADIERQETDPARKLLLKDELMADYAIKSERIHTIQQLLRAYALFEKDDEYVVIENKVKIVDEQTGRIMEGRRYSDGLHQAIEAKENVKVEAATQTFATITLQNFFRMYKKLSGMTGTAETEAGELWDIYKLDVVVIPTNRPIARDDRDDLVYKTRREKFNAIIDEIVALVEAGRPVLVGTTSVEISELLSRMLKLRKIEHNVLNAKLHKREADIVAQAGNAGTVTIATNMAGRGTDIKLSPEVKKAGGLAIVGTERHESRRVDRQLRGRAGRQGDPGSSQFFVSLEDNLMRLFASEKIARLMDRFGQPDGEAIQHGMITNSIERAQRKVEENNFGTRKRLLEYDDVMNSQREVIYKQRRHALYGDRIGVDISNMMYDMAFALATEARKGMDFTEFHFEVFKTLHIETNITETEYPKLSVDALTDRLHHTLIERYMRKTRSMQEESYPVIKRMYDENSTPGRMVYVPFTDGSRKWQIVVDLQKAHDTHCKELTKSFEKASILATIDDSWKEHLRELDDLKQSVQSASYEQKDPLLIYKFESFELFQRMLEHNNKKISSTLIQGHILSNAPAARVQTEYVPPKLDLSKLNLSRADELNSNRQAVTSDRQETKKVETFVRTEKKVGRNEPCPCGSGKKFKQCHGKNQPDI